LLKDDALLDRILAGWKSAELGAKRDAMLRYVEKLTLRPASVEKGDVTALRDAGFEDEDVLAICEVAGYYAYANRMVDGLGVLVEDWLPPG